MYLENAQADTNFISHQKKINYLMYMGIKLFTRNEEEFEILIQAVRINNDDIRMDFAIVTCAMLIIKSGKRQMTEGIELPNQEKSERSKKIRNLQILGIIGSEHHQTSRDTRKKEYLGRKRKLLETKLYRRNFIKNIKTWAVHPRKIVGSILKLDQRRTSTNEPEH